jgi:hypothetical protein
MKVNDKNLKKQVDVMCKDCLKFKCYWPRLDPGIFNQGQGYKHRSDNWLCGTREINGCPDSPVKKDD